MTAGSAASQCLSFGHEQSVTLRLQARQIVKEHCLPAVCADVPGQVRQRLESPLNFPPLEMAIVPDDQIVIALERQTPGATQIIAELWRVFERRSVNPEDVLILQPASWKTGSLPDPRTELPESVRKAVRWQIHDATDKKREAYLANSTSGERIYLAREVIDAGFVLPIGPVEFDPLLGVRSAASSIFPGLSNVDAMSKTRGQEHSELSPEDDRPLRQLEEEVAWLLGVQMGIEVLTAGSGRCSDILIGEIQSVSAAARKWMKQHWLIALRERCEMVVAAVDDGGTGTTWDSVGAALQAARGLVQRGGKIVLLTNLNAEPTEGMQFIRQSEAPREALKPLRLESPPDLIAASRLASAADWAQVYLLSGLKADVVESLFMTPLESAGEAVRLIEQGESRTLLHSAQHCFGYVR